MAEQTLKSRLTTIEKTILLFLAVIALLEGFNVYSEKMTPEEATQFSKQQVIAAEDRQKTLAALEAVTLTVVQLNRRMEKNEDTLMNVASLVQDLVSATKVFEAQIDNIHNLPRPDNTARALSNTEENIRQAGQIKSIEQRTLRLEKIHEINGE
jgi:hypothetical protein